MNVLESKKKQVNTCMLVDSDHAGDKKSCKSMSDSMIKSSLPLYSVTQRNHMQQRRIMVMKQGIDALIGLP